MQRTYGTPLPCVSIDGFLDVSNQSVFHFIAQIPIPIHVHYFRLNAERVFPNNSNAKIANLNDDCIENFQITRERITVL